jgi:hypothetical protein
MPRRASGRIELGRASGYGPGWGDKMVLGGLCAETRRFRLVLPNTRGIAKSSSGSSVWVLVFMISRLDGRRHQRGDPRPPDDMVGGETWEWRQDGCETEYCQCRVAESGGRGAERVRSVGRYTWATRSFQGRVGLESVVRDGFASFREDRSHRICRWKHSIDINVTFTRQDHLLPISRLAR